jgi:hypothetical protein
MDESNWMRRDVLIKQRLGLESDYWQRAGKILRLNRDTGVSPVLGAGERHVFGVR